MMMMMMIEHLVGFIIRVYQDARSSERQSLYIRLCKFAPPISVKPIS